MRLVSLLLPAAIQLGFLTMTPAVLKSLQCLWDHHQQQQTFRTDGCCTTSSMLRCAAWRDAQAAAEEARRIEHDKWALAQRLGKEADEATAERLSVMRERVSGLKQELGSVKEEITTTTSFESSSSNNHHPVDVSVSGKGDRDAKVKVAVEE